MVRDKYGLDPVRNHKTVDEYIIIKMVCLMKVLQCNLGAIQAVVLYISCGSKKRKSFIFQPCVIYLLWLCVCYVCVMCLGMRVCFCLHVNLTRVVRLGFDGTDHQPKRRAGQGTTYEQGQNEIGIIFEWEWNRKVSFLLFHYKTTCIFCHFVLLLGEFLFPSFFLFPQFLISMPPHITIVHVHFHHPISKNRIVL